MRAVIRLFALKMQHGVHYIGMDGGVCHNFYKLVYKRSEAPIS